MIRPRWIARLRRWSRTQPRWPLTRQISLVFALMMLANATAIIFVSAFLDSYLFEREFSTLSSGAQRTYDVITAGNMPPPKDVEALTAELKPIGVRLAQQSTSVLYGLIVVAGFVTFGFGYLVLGRKVKGLTNMASAARHIADGDLAQRAAPITFASREEARLIADFNFMAGSLQRAERELAASTASIAHELRTPLTILRGRLHGFCDGIFAMDVAAIEGLLFQVESLSRLVDDLQTLSLANSDRLFLTLEKSDLSREVRRVMMSVEPDLNAAGLSVVLDLAPAILRGDAVRLRQVIAAVFSNAVRYAPNSGILRVSTRTEKSEALLEILDHGPGLPGDVGNIAFDRFWRGEASRSRNTGGSGLGLAVVRAIVEAHGGTATIANHIGGGTIFRMSLPCRL
jgi:two-component system, OmpR family, sensor histidine kinase AdeS